MARQGVLRASAGVRVRVEGKARGGLRFVRHAAPLLWLGLGSGSELGFGFGFGVRVRVRVRPRVRVRARVRVT